MGIDSRTWHFGHELLRRLPGLKDTDFPWLACHQEFSSKLPAPIPREPKDSSGKELDSEEQRVGRLISEFGGTSMKNITQISFNWSVLASFGKVLSHLTKLQELYSFIPDLTDSHIRLSATDFRQIVPTIGATVGSTLVKLIFSRAPEMAYIDDFIKPLGDRSRFPSLKVFNVTRLHWSLSDKDSRIERVKLLYEICKASKRHSQWKFPHRSLPVDVLELAVLEAEQIKTLYLWLCENILEWDGEVLLKEISLLNPVEVIPELESFLKKMEKIADVVPLKLRIESIFPPTKKSKLMPVIKKFAPRLVQLTASLSMVDPDGGNDEELITSSAQLGFMEWTLFLEEFLPLCKNMHTFRTISQTGGNGADIALERKLESTLAKLCRVHKLRHLDIDLASLLQPETLPGALLLNGNEEPGEGPRKVIQGLAWISTPHGSMMKPDFKNCLQNLRTLKMKNLFIFRQVEMVWFTNLTAKLKNLELIEVHGLVWHVGYEKGESDSGDDDDYGEDDYGRHRNGDDDKWEDSDFDVDEIPSLKEVGEQIGKLGLVNRLDADSSLLSWLPEDSESDSDSESEEDEEMVKRLAHGNLSKDDDDDDDTHSTDSNFGSDPRFTKAVNEELRITRLNGWICKVLVETAKKTGGRCREVVIKDLRVDGRGLDPWTLDHSFSAYSGGGEDDY